MSAATSGDSPADRRPRVLQIVTRLGLGGAESITLSLIRGLHQDFEFGVFAVRGIERSATGHAMQQDLIALGVPIFCGPALTLKQGGMFFAGLRARRVIQEFSPAIVHLHTEIPESTYAMILALQPRRTRLPIVRTIHNSDYWKFSPRLGRWCERRMGESFVACISRDAQAAFTAHRERSLPGPLPVPPTVIYNGVSTPERSVLSRPFNSTAPIRILFAGRFEKEKGADLLPTAIRHVSPLPMGAELVLHGHGSFGPTLQSLAANPPLGWTIHVRAAVTDLPARMSEFDLVIVPSRAEGLSLVAIEAMLMGVPVVGTDAPGLREALPPDHRWRAPAGEARGFAAQLQRAMHEPEQWRAVAAHAQAFARHRFDYATMLNAYAALYRQAIAHESI